ncbi:MAG TPA: hypothetical protein VJO12_16465 [Stellaceae bacterium]|nr:hypothetical protein [Stellaceae bacterium]
MRRRLALSLASLLLLATAGCMHTQPVYDVHDETLPAGALGLSHDEVGRKLAEAAARARWRVDRVEPTQVVATYDAGSHSATVAITWSERTYSIGLVNSYNLREEGGQIHRTYNGWVRGLEREINSALYSAQPATGVTPPMAATAAAAPARVATATTAVPVPSRPVPSFGDSVPFACPQPGTTIEFRSGAKIVFDAAEGVYCPYESSGRRQLGTAFGIYDRESAQALAKLWPLKLGSQVTFLRRSGQASYRERYRVTRRVSVTVRAGTFDAFLVDWSVIAVNGAPSAAYSENGSFWYAPELGWIVKTQHDSGGGGFARLADDEAVRITR